MAQPSLESPLDLEGKTKPYLELIRRIDEILAAPVESLIKITHEYINKSKKRDSERMGFPVWVSDHIQPEPEDDLFSKVICFATLQEIWKLRRRFPWLAGSDSKLEDLLKTKRTQPDQESAPNQLIKNLLPENEFKSCLETLSSNTFGALDPVTASQTYHVLMRDSERQTHGALGSMALFAMIWPLFRRFPDPQRFGAAIEPWEPKAYVTAKCILPIKTLQDICTERASLMTEIVKILGKLESTTKDEKHNPYQRWRFNAELDDLRVHLSRLSSIVVPKEKLRHYAGELRDFSDGLSQDLGSSLLTIEDLKNPTALAIKLRDCRDKLSAYVKQRCGQDTRKHLDDYDGSGPPARKLVASLVDELNFLLKGPCLFEVDRFEHIKLGEEIKKFAEQKPRGHAGIRLNWRLLKEAYPDEIAMSQGVAASYQNILRGAARAIREIGKDGVEVLQKADEILKQINTKIIKRLNQPSPDDLKYLADWGFKFAREYTAHPNDEMKTAYFNDLHASAQSGLNVCRRALEILKDSYSRCSGVTSNLDTIKEMVSQLAAANTKVAAMMDDLVRDATAWCRTVADREIAHASAKNLTDFDPSELVSAIAVAVKWNQMTTVLQISDAVDKALAGMRADGSWSPGQPFYSPNNAVGVWPITSDVVLTLTEALEGYREVDVADAALFRYVDWLERTRTELKLPNQDQKTTEHVVGWPSDRFRHRRKIHFPTTAYSINALLKIRDLVEHRLWQLCEKRFTVIRSHDRSGLKEAAPVDLGAQHSHRLHRHLAWIAEQQKSDYKKAEYSIVLHGPPGSSKTFIVQALSVEQWKATRLLGSKDAPRLVRITPADFTRMGEDRLDSEARLIFDLLSGVRGVTIFFDEIDDLLRQRNTQTGPSAPKPTFMELVVPAMLNRLADLRDACPRQELCVVLATNFIESIEPALIRKGRIDRPFPVVYPDQESRHALIIDLISKRLEIPKDDELNEKEISRSINLISEKLAKRSKRWPYLTIKSACHTIVEVLKCSIDDLRSEEGKKLSLEEKKKRFEENGHETIDRVVEEHAPDISVPKYEERLAPQIRPELLNEYAHYLIASFINGKDLLTWINENRNKPERESKEGPEEEHNRVLTGVFQAVCKRIKSVLEDENRWIEDRTIRERLESASGSNKNGDKRTATDNDE